MRVEMEQAVAQASQGGDPTGVESMTRSDGTLVRIHTLEREVQDARAQVREGQRALRDVERERDTLQQATEEFSRGAKADERAAAVELARVNQELVETRQRLAAAEGDAHSRSLAAARRYASRRCRSFAATAACWACCCRT